jgi:DNA polymerase-3 subunit epsilon
MAKGEEMTLTRPIIFFDTETTGLDVSKDQITSLAMTKVNPDGSQVRWHSLFKVTIPISAEASEKTGITAETLKDAPSLASKAAEIVQFMEGCDLAGFNVIGFDVPILWENLNRVGVKWDTRQHYVLDAGNIFKKKEPRTLSAAVKFYTGFEMQNAHDAGEDVQATIDVFAGQQQRYPDLAAMTVAEAAAFSRMDGRIDLAGKIVRNAQGEACYAFGKAKGVRVVDDTGYGRWMLKSDFSKNTKQVLRELLS